MRNTNAIFMDYYFLSNILIIIIKYSDYVLGFYSF